MSPPTSMSLIHRFRSRAPFYLLPFTVSASAFRLLRRKWLEVRCRLYGMKVGRNVHIGPALHFVLPWNVSIGDQCVLGHSVRLWSEHPAGTLWLGKGVEVGRDCLLDFSGGLTVEDGALLSEGCIVYTHDHGHDPRSIPAARPLIIGKGAWIGARAIVLPSVRFIGAGALVGAGAVVAKDVPPGEVFVGAAGRQVSRREARAA